MGDEMQPQRPGGADEVARPGAAGAPQDSLLGDPPRPTTPRRPGAKTPALPEPPWELICGECGGPAYVYLPSPEEGNRREACYVWGLGGHLCRERERWPVVWCGECAGMHVEGDHDDGFCVAAPLSRGAL